MRGTERKQNTTPQLWRLDFSLLTLYIHTPRSTPLQNRIFTDKLYPKLVLFSAHRTSEYVPSMDNSSFAF